MMAYMFALSHIYWKVVNEDATNKPPSFLDFWNEKSTELIRLGDRKKKDVEE